MMGSSIARDTEGLFRRRTVLIAVTTAITLIVIVVLDGWRSPGLAIVEGLVVGLALGVCVAFAWDRFTGRLRTVSDVETATGLPVLATIPPIGGGDREAPAIADNRSDEATQAYRRLAAELAFDLRESGANCLLITSPVRRSGRTTTAVNLAARFAANGMHVVLVSADARGERVDQRLGLSPRPGLMDVLDGTNSLESALQPSGRARLRVLAAGTPSERGSVGYSLDDLARLLDQLAKTVDLVLIEAPPVFGGVETVLLAQEVDLVLVTVDVRNGRRSDAATAVAYLGHVQDKLVGAIANDPGRRRGPASALAARLHGLRRTVGGAIATAVGGVTAAAGLVTRSTKGALGSAARHNPFKGRRWAGAVAIATVAALVIGTALWLGYDGRSAAQQGDGGDGRSETQPGDDASETSLSATSSPADSIDTALTECRAHWDAQNAPLGAAADSMEQWEVHIDAMNQLVAGEITLEQASAFWEQSRVGAAEKAERFFVADSAYTDGEYSCQPPTSARQGDPGMTALMACRHAITQREEAIQAARTAIGTWHHHVMDMNLLRAGKMSPERAIRLWNKYWRQGAAEVHDYRAQMRQIEGTSCTG